MYIDTKLSNGMRVIGERISGFHSVSMGVWVRTGSVLEPPAVGGVSHFIEHMLFKGTKTRTALDISAQIDAIGGQINAFTSKECTCFYVKVMDESVQVGVDILSDMLQHSLLAPEEIQKEQGVVVEEIGMSFDNPEDHVHELLAQQYFKGHPLGRPILGTKQSVRDLRRPVLVEYMDTHYTAENTVFAIAGNFEEQAILDMLEEAFRDMPTGGKQYFPPAYQPRRGDCAVEQRDIAQVHVAMALPGLPLDDPDQYNLYVLNNAFGGSMSSRLFQTIREQHGLAYSVFSFTGCYRNTGTFGVYLGTGPDQAMQAMELVAQEFHKLLEQGLSEEEFRRCRNQLRGNYILGQEGTSSRMMALGKSVTLLGRAKTPEETLRQLDEASLRGAMDCAHRLLDMDRMCIAMVGAAPDAEEARKLF